jgi:hypothetical protein
MPGLLKALTRQRPTPIFEGWWIVAISLVVDSCKHGTLNRGLTLDVLPIRNESGRVRGAAS